MGKIRSFAPIIGSKPRVLILGTMPGAESLRKREYYAYKHNQFWKIIYKVFGDKPPDNYADRERSGRNCTFCLPRARPTRLTLSRAS